MSMDINELKAESSAELLPGREALGRCSFKPFRNIHITKHCADGHSWNGSRAWNTDSHCAHNGFLAGQGDTLTH
jgi:hypothetical protein